MILLLISALSFLQVDDDAADSIRNPNVTVESLPQLAIADAMYPGMQRDQSGVLHLWYFREADGVKRLEMRRLLDAEFTAPVLVSASDKMMVNWADTPRFASGKDGSGIITWLESNGHGYGVKFAFSREAGAAFTEPRWLHQDQVGAEHGFVSIVALGDGGFFGVWLQGGNFGSNGEYQTSLMGVVINADGSLADKEIVLDALVCDCCDTDSAIFASGNVVVTYRDRNSEEHRDTYYVRGNPLQPDSFTAAMPVGAGGWKITTCPVNGPALDNSSRHAALAFFTDKEWTAPRLQIAQSKSSGKTFGLPLIVSAFGTLGRADVAYLPEGLASVAWLQEIDDEVWWVAKAIPRKGMAGPLSKIAQVSGARSAGFISLAAGEDGVIAAYTDKGKLSFSSIKLKQAAVDLPKGQPEK
ncbi:MAG: hypothetical protein ACI84O_000498 [Myxococcota bacterium]|jgi:hypothetical protein